MIHNAGKPNFNNQLIIVLVEVPQVLPSCAPSHIQLPLRHIPFGKLQDSSVMQPDDIITMPIYFCMLKVTKTTSLHPNL